MVRGRSITYSSNFHFMVPGEGFEPPTFGLQNRCTTTVLTRQKIDQCFCPKSMDPTSLGACTPRIRHSRLTRFLAPSAIVALRHPLAPLGTFGATEQWLACP